MDVSKKYLIIVAGGIGKRMGHPLPKQFVEIGGKALMLHTITRFTDAIPGIHIVVVMHADWHAHWEAICTDHAVMPHQVVTGGKERFHSVKKGLEALPDAGIVAIHDAVRPLVAAETIQRCFNAAAASGAAVPVAAINDSLRIIEGDRTRAIDRNTVVTVQTPQCFELARIKAAFKQDYQPHYTDDASVFEAYGESITTVEGNAENIKITRPIDLKMAELLLSMGDA